MKEIGEYTPTTPAAELYLFLSELIITQKIRSFSALMDYAKGIPLDQKTAAVYTRLFRLLKKLNWGFFKEIDPDTFPKIWREIVIPHPQLKKCGELKRNLTISEVFVGILDLHGYTRFCETNKNNLSMLQMLDDMIQVDVVKIAQEHDVVLQRRNGDEMVLVGTTASDMLMVTLRIMDYFSKKRLINFPNQSDRRSGYKIILQDMHISAGIAGGKKFTPFIITQDGDLSGGVVNTAARLQARANELSSERSRILITKTVFTSFESETKADVPALLREKQIAFLDSGWISFKGIDVALQEVVIEEQDRYKLEIEGDLQNLYKAAENNSWRDNLFIELVHLLMRIFKTMPQFKFETYHNGLVCMMKNDFLYAIAQEMLQKFKAKQDYSGAITDLKELIGYCRDIPNFDRLCLEYADKICAMYQLLKDAFDAQIKQKIQEKAQTSLPAKYRQLWEESGRSAQIRERLTAEIQKSITPLEVSLLWTGVVDAHAGELSVGIYSGKK